MSDINGLADMQFKAKSSELMHMSPYEVACGDQKKFTIKDKNDKQLSIGFGVVETTDPRAMKTRIDELMVEVASLKSEQMLDFSFLAIVDIVNLTSTLISIGRAESELAEAAWKRKIGERIGVGWIGGEGGGDERRKLPCETKFPTPPFPPPPSSEPPQRR